MELIPIYNSEMARDFSLSVAAVYGLLWQSCNFGTNTIKVSYNEISDFIGLSRSSVLREIKKLEDAGLIRVSRIKVGEENSRNIYEVVDIRKYPCDLPECNN